MNLKAIHFVFFVISATAFATEENDNPCNAQGGGVTAGYMCVAQKNKLADEQLNAEYKKAIKRTEEEEIALRQNWRHTELVSLFRSSQRAWLKFRDAECKFRGISSTPSPWQDVQVEECKLRMTIERTEYFKGVHSG
ncbi:lysozyme inhibitor LprI family protein [Stutzerimonas stutzeri]|uniref:lysozyme inhibitor LprI family protein n=1 Tax=Stutzerimonas stutzeri TaxID=316 RepID=UPI001E40E722|nr:lysozyme inhibitor LprI family protein [Stutzerimonas stutzeri]